MVSGAFPLPGVAKAYHGAMVVGKVAVGQTLNSCAAFWTASPASTASTVPTILGLWAAR